MNTPPKSVAVLFGGTGTEHSVSVHTGINIINHLPPDRYRVIPAFIAKDGQWFFDTDRLERPLHKDRYSHIPPERFLSPAEAAVHLHNSRIDCVYIGLHGAGGEDGCIQGYLEMIGVPYCGSGISASALAFDKIRANQFLSAHRIKVPNHFALDIQRWRSEPGFIDGLTTSVPSPWVIKSPCQGSSFGIRIVQQKDRLAQALNDIFQLGQTVMIEEYINGREFTCGVIDNRGELTSLPVTEIIPQKSSYFDFESKYTQGASEEITPAGIDNRLTESIQQISTRVFQLLGCSGMGRVDVKVSEENEIYVLELNTLPGMTETSLLPQGAAAAGITYEQLLDIILESARR